MTLPSTAVVSIPEKVFDPFDILLLMTIGLSSRSAKLLVPSGDSTNALIKPSRYSNSLL